MCTLPCCRRQWEMERMRQLALPAGGRWGREQPCTCRRAARRLAPATSPLHTQRCGPACFQTQGSWFKLIAKLAMNTVRTQRCGPACFQTQGSGIRLIVQLAMSPHGTQRCPLLAVRGSELLVRECMRAHAIWHTTSNPVASSCLSPPTSVLAQRAPVLHESARGALCTVASVSLRHLAEPWDQSDYAPVRRSGPVGSRQWSCAT